MATITTSGADAVRLVSNERLDIPDFDAATYELNSDQLSRAFGMLVGSVLGTTQPFNGCASAPTTSFDTGSKFLTINGCLIYQGGSASVPSTAPAGRLIAYDPTQPWQSTLTGVSLSAYSPSTPCVVWALPGTNTSNLETRKRWQPGASAESSFSTEVRERTIIDQFTALPVGTAPPSSAWIPVLKIASWSAGSPVVTVVSMWDGTPNMSYVGVTSTQMPISAPNIGYLLYMIRKGLAYILDNTGGDNWAEAAANPYSGLKQLDDDITTINADITTLDNTFTALCQHVTVASFTIYYTGGAWTLLLPSSNTNAQLASWSRLSAGYFTFQIKSGVMVATSGYVDSLTGVQVTIRSGTTGAGAIIYNTSLITDAAAGTFTIQFLDSAGAHADPPNNGFSVAVTGRKA